MHEILWIFNMHVSLGELKWCKTCFKQSYIVYAENITVIIINDAAPTIYKSCILTTSDDNFFLS